MRETIKRSFTLLELIIVVIILGVLATFGIQQYMRMIEKSRGAEAKIVLGVIRTAMANLRLRDGSLNAGGFNSVNVGLGLGSDQIPISCTPTHYFWYGISGISANTFTAVAKRCVTKGKPPNAPSETTLSLEVNFDTGVDNWSGTGGY